MIIQCANPARQAFSDTSARYLRRKLASGELCVHSDCRSKVIDSHGLYTLSAADRKELVQSTLSGACAPTCTPRCHAVPSTGRRFPLAVPHCAISTHPPNHLEEMRVGRRLLWGGVRRHLSGWDSTASAKLSLPQQLAGTVAWTLLLGNRLSWRRDELRKHGQTCGAGASGKHQEAVPTMRRNVRQERRLAAPSPRALRKLRSSSIPTVTLPFLWTSSPRSP